VRAVYDDIMGDAQDDWVNNFWKVCATTAYLRRIWATSSR